jgi:hypothetical protein
MAKKLVRGRGRGQGRRRGKLSGTIGKSEGSSSTVDVGPSESEDFADAVENGFLEDMSSNSLGLINSAIAVESSPIVEVIEPVIDEEDGEFGKNWLIDDDYQSVDSRGGFPSLGDPVHVGGFPSLGDPMHEGEFPSLGNLVAIHDDPKHDPEIDTKEWSGLFKNERTMGNLEFFEPKKVGGRTFITPPDEAVEEGISRWRSCLVGQLMDKSLPYFLVKKVAASMWRKYGEVEVYSLENGMFIFRFHDEASCDEILESRVWHVSNKSLILRKWQPGMQVLKLNLSSEPVWVKFIHLPMEFWTPTCLSYVASGIGKPLYADKVTEEQKRLGFARVLIEIDVQSDCPKELTICRSNGATITVGVEYPWLPPKCSTCGNFGHAAYACAKKEKVWIPKMPRNGLMKKSSPVSKQIPFEKPIRTPVGGSKPTSKTVGIQLSNSFATIGRMENEEDDEEEIRVRTPTTFLEIFEQAISSRDKGKGKMNDSPTGEKGFSPQRMI